METETVTAACLSIQRSELIKVLLLNIMQKMKNAADMQEKALSEVKLVGRKIGKTRNYVKPTSKKHRCLYRKTRFHKLPSDNFQMHLGILI